MDTSPLTPKRSVVMCKGISKRYNYLYALKGVDFTVEAGEVLGLLGPNGSGKSTLMRIIATITQPSEGSVEIFKQKSTKSSEKIRSRIGAVFHSSFLYDDLTGRENLRFFLKLAGVKGIEAEKRINAYLEEKYLEYWLERPCRELSKGMRKRLDIIRALIHEPELLLFDEPFSGLDVRNQQLLNNLIHKERGKRTFIISTHIFSQALEICDRIVVLRKGKVVLTGIPEEIDSQSIARYFSE